MQAANCLLSRRSVLLGALGSFACLTLGGESCAAASRQGLLAPLPSPPLFTDTEREAIRAYWNAPGRYAVAPSPDIKDRVNVTVDGSTWYWTLLHTKKPDPAAAATWQEWLVRKATYEKACCCKAREVPENPGPAPASLIAATGMSCPVLYEHVVPERYLVTFAADDASAPFVYEDGVDFGKRSAYYPYFRSRTGVMRPGKRVKDYAGDDRKHLDSLFAAAGRSDSERRVLQAVSNYEGGFEAINTYDTGFVSVGFLQFITGADGTGSLARVLARYKSDDPQGFAADFHRFGVDVTADGVVDCVDPATGEEMHGSDAVHRIIDDKRLTAIFERAAASDGFRLAQIAVARDMYWPGDDPALPLPVPVAGEPASIAGGDSPESPETLDPPVKSDLPPAIRVSDIVHSEAGLATLMDRKVNKGHLRELPDVVARLMKEKGLTDPHDMARYERSLIVAMKYRGDFLADPTLSQPPAEPESNPDANRSAHSIAPEQASSGRRRR